MNDDMSNERSEHAAAHEMGRMSEQMRSLTVAIQGLQSVVQDMAKHFASQRDLDRVEETANLARDNAAKANGRLDSLTMWEKVGAGLILALILYAMKVSAAS